MSEQSPGEAALRGRARPHLIYLDAAEVIMRQILNLSPMWLPIALGRKLRSVRARNVGVSLTLAFAMAFFAWRLNQAHPFDQWLIRSHIRLWALTALFGSACLSMGWRALPWLVSAPPRLLERLTLSFGLGVVLFFLGLFLGGLLGVLTWGYFYGLPLTLIAVSAPHCLTSARRAYRRLEPFGSSLFLPRGLVEYGALLFLFISLTIVYLSVLYPDNLSYDAQWYHLPVAENYASSGAIRPFREGWFLGTYPQLSSILYTWGLLGPGKLHERTLLCGQIEFLLFIATLLSVSVLASKLVGKRLPFAAAVFFLFPGIFVYDSCLCTGADHILAFFTPLIAITLMRFAKHPSPGEGALAGTVLAGALCTKYQACYLVPPAVLGMTYLALKHRSPRAWLAWAFAASIVSAPHWLKNLLFYGDPLYPLLHQWFPSKPYLRDTGIWIAQYYWPESTKPVGFGWLKYLNTLLATLDFSFAPDARFDWNSAAFPLFGSLFTLLIPTLFWLKRKAHLWPHVAAIHLGLAVWYLTTHQERFLQTLTPWMAAVSAALLVLVWQHGTFAKLALTALVGLQLVWGADLFTLPKHSMNGRAPLSGALEYFASGYDARKTTRDRLPNTLENLGPRLQPGSRALLHTYRMRLGLGIEAITDEAGWQGAIDYLTHQTPLETRAVWAQVRAPQVIWQPNRGAENPAEVARELVFLRAIQQYTKPSHQTPGFYVEDLAAAPEDLALASQKTTIAWYVSQFGWATGVYNLEDFAQSRPSSAAGTCPASPPLSPEEFARINAVALENDCAASNAIRGMLGAQFVKLGTLSNIELWVRSEGGK